MYRQVFCGGGCLRYWRGLAFGAGAVICLAWVWLVGLPTVWGPIVATDVVQERGNVPLPVPTGQWQIVQSFVSRWDGLREVDVWFFWYGKGDENGRFSLALYDEQGTLLARTELSTVTLRTNQRYTWRFPLQPHSAGHTYRLVLSGNEANTVSVWGYSLDVYSGGEARLESALAASLPPTTAQELRFVTRYQLTGMDALMALGTILWREGGFLLVGMLLFPLPGVLLLLISGWGRHWDGLAWWGVALALGVAIWPLLWYGLTLAGGRWRAGKLWFVMLAGWGTAVFWWWHIGRPKGRWRRGHGWVLLLLLAGMGVRLLAVRDVVFPLWVDSVRHGLITAVMTETGQTPTDYASFLPVDRFPYHFGFHTLAASLAIMTDWPLPRLLLYLGQWLNGLVPLTMYAAAWLVTRRQRAGVLAAFLVAFPFFFPAYYASWGRFTQLTAVLILPVLLALTWLIVHGARHWLRMWWVVAVLGAGLFYIHLRVFLYFLPFAGVVWLAGRGRNGRWLAQTAVLGSVLILPRVGQLWQMNQVQIDRVLVSSAGDYYQFPVAYLNAGWERPFLWLVILSLIPLIPLVPKTRWSRLPALLVTWVATLFLLLAGHRLGLPETYLVNPNSMYIILFVPTGLFLAITGNRFWRWMQKWWWPLQTGGWLLGGVILTAVFLYGIRQQITILNPQTMLAWRADLPALSWVNEHVPETAVFAVNSWRWLGTTWSGSDGGAWLVPLTRRQSTTPPADYIYNPDLARQVKAFNETAVQLDWSTPQAINWLTKQGVTHIFVGAKGGFFDPATLAQNPQLKTIYQQNGAFIFQINPSDTPSRP